MYRIYAYPFGNPQDKRLLYEPNNREALVLSPKLTREVSKGGSLSFTMTRDHEQYSNLQKMSTCVTVEQSETLPNSKKIVWKEIWRGRVLSHEADWNNRRVVYCEGALSYFNDSAITPFNYEGNLRQFLQHLIDAHNQQCGEMRMKRFELGTVTAAFGDLVVHYGDMDSYGVGEDYGSTWDIIDKMILKVYGGYAYCSYNSATGNNILNYCDQAFEADRLVNQTIEYGVNLLDFSEKTDTNNMFTRVYPMGNKHSVTRTEWVWKFLWWGKKTEVEDHEERYSIKDATSAATSQAAQIGYSYSLYQADGDCNWIQNDAAVAKFGVVAAVKDYDADSPDELFLAALEDLQKNSLMTTSYTVKAVDLVDAGHDKERLGFAKYAHIISKPHSIDVVMLCTKLVEPLDAPDKKEYTFGMTRQTLTDRQVANLGKTNLLEEQTSTSERYSGNIYDWVTKYKTTNDAAVKKVGEQATEAAKTATNFLSFDKNTGLRVGHESLAGKYVQIANDGILVTDENSRVSVKSDSIAITNGDGSCTISSGRITFYGLRDMDLTPAELSKYDTSIEFAGQYVEIPFDSKDCAYVWIGFETSGTNYKPNYWGTTSTAERERVGTSFVIAPTNGQIITLTFPWNTLQRRDIQVFNNKIRIYDGYKRRVTYKIDVPGSGSGTWTTYLSMDESTNYSYINTNEWVYAFDACIPRKILGFM